MRDAQEWRFAVDGGPVYDFRWNGSRTVNVYVNGHNTDCWQYSEQSSPTEVHESINEYLSDLFDNKE